MLTRHGPEGQALNLHTHFGCAKVLARRDLGKIRSGNSHLLGKPLGGPALAGLDKCFKVHERSLVSAKPFCQAFASSVDTKQTDAMQTVEIRRARLKKWFDGRSMPADEKSYLSQLINGKSSFGEKAARRLESTYGMPAMYLDTPLDASAPDIEQGDAWAGLSAQRRDLIQRIASQDVPDGMIEAISGILKQAQPPQSKPAPKRPASAVSGGPPRSGVATKKTVSARTKR